jgi:hypothetical protein
MTRRPIVCSMSQAAVAQARADELEQQRDHDWVQAVRMVQVMEYSDLVMQTARLDSSEQRGDGLRELHQRFKDAVTSTGFEAIAVEAARRLRGPTLEPPIETAYAVLIGLARRRARALAVGIAPARNGDR